MVLAYFHNINLIILCITEENENKNEDDTDKSTINNHYQLIVISQNEAIVSFRTISDLF